MKCHCGRLARGFGWTDPVRRGPVISACSMRCMRVIAARKGDMKLLQTELEVIERVIGPHVADVQAFFDAKPDYADVLEYMAWAFSEISDGVADAFSKDVTIHDIPY